jgi:lactoylglutathione lyase
VDPAFSPGPIAAITLFVDDVAVAKRFCSDVFRLPVAFEDESSVVFTFGETLVNLLKASEAHSLVAPAAVAAQPPTAAAPARHTCRPASRTARA